MVNVTVSIKTDKERNIHLAFTEMNMTQRGRVMPKHIRKPTYHREFQQKGIMVMTKNMDII